MNWDEGVRRLYTLERRGIKLDLDRVRACLNALSRPQDSWRAVLVAGTNGKGSTSAALASALALGPRRVGLYTSPHLLDFRERIRVGGRLADRAALLRRMEADWEIWERHECSFFEAATALAFSHFRDVGVEIAVLEVGLGGRLDATNTVEPILSVVTTLGMDHAHILGSTAAAIAREKAGILRPGVPAVVDGGVPGGPAAVAECAREIGAPLFRRHACLRVSGIASAVPVDARADGPLPAAPSPPALRFSVARRGGAPPGFRLPAEGLALESTLPGAHQAGNLSLAALALTVLRERGVDVADSAIARGLARVRWPGRLERPLPGQPLLADVAHNREGARALAHHLAPLAGGLLPVVGMVEQKDHLGFFRELARVTRRVHLAPLRNERAAPADALAEAARQAGLAVVPFATVAGALEAALQEARRPGGPLVLLCGSFHTLEEGYHALGVPPLESLWEDSP